MCQAGKIKVVGKNFKKLDISIGLDVFDVDIKPTLVFQV
jgi:hypothetical protein